MALALAGPDSLVHGNLRGEVRHPERFSRSFTTRVQQAQRQLLEPAIDPAARPAHTHTTLLLQAGVHPKIVSERLGHAKGAITLDVYSHAVPTLPREAASKLAALVYGGIA